jgi:hypothetical protein
VNVGGVPDILEVHYTSTFRVRVCNMDEFVCVYISLCFKRMVGVGGGV